MNTKEEIISFQPAKDFFIGIDSDGTAFDSMTLKHLKSFIPAALETWDFGEKAGDFSDIWKRVCFNSTSRGINRFIGLTYVLDQLKVIDKNIIGDDLGPLWNYIEKCETHSNASLQEWISGNPGPLLEQVMRWSLKSDKLFEEQTQGLLPFPNVEPALKIMTEKADIMVVSAASGKGLDKDWAFSNLTKYTSLLAGMELGSKANQLRMAATGKYDPQKLLMIGDAPGDMEAAHSIKGLFYPVIPGSEDESWIRLKEEGLGKFFDGTFQGEYESALINDFMEFLDSNR
ncbi:MAG: hypothetical protein FWH38_09000 [Treponema sp.]|nr:hypothetical protein [Treponema sp.]